MSSINTRKKKFPSQVAFLVFVAAFAGWAYVSQYKGKKEQREAREKSQAIVPFSVETIQEVQLRPKSAPEAGPRPKIELYKDGAIWRLRSPVSDLADETSVAGFLSTISMEKTKETVVEAQDIDWSIYGLKSDLKPDEAADIVIRTKDAQRTIQLGTVKAYDGSLYARVDGANRVDLVSAALEGNLLKTDREFRDKRLFDIKDIATEASTVKEIEVVNSGQKFRLVKRDGVWVDANSAKASGDSFGDWPLDQKKVTDLIETSLGLRGSDIWGEDKSEKRILVSRKLDRPAISVKLVGEKQTRDFKVAPLEKDQSLTAAIGSERTLIFAIYKAQYEDLSKPLDHYLDRKKPFQFKLADVQSLQFFAGKNGPPLPLEVKKEKNGEKTSWVLGPVAADTSKFEFKPEQIDVSLGKVLELTADSILPKGTEGPLASAAGSIRLRVMGAGAGDKPKLMAELTFLEKADGKVRVSSSLAAGRVVEIKKDSFEELGFKKILLPRLGAGSADSKQADQSPKPSLK